MPAPGSVFNNSGFHLFMTKASDGSVLAGTFSGTIERFAANGASLGTFASVSGVVLGLATAGDGSIYVVHGNGAGGPYAVEHLDGVTGASLGTIGPASNFYQDVAVAPNGNVILDNTNSIGVYSAGGSLINTISLPGTTFNILAALNGDIFAAAGNSVYRCAGCQTGSGSFLQFGSFSTPSGLNGMVITGGNLLVASRFGGVIHSLNATTGAYQGVFSSAGGSGPWDLELLSDAGVPEPGSAVLLLLGGAALAAWKRRLANAYA